MSEIIKNIFAPQLSFEGQNNTDKFTKLFCDLYRIELFKDGLDLIATKTAQKDITFEVKIIKGWDTNLGCYLTEQNKTYNKIFGTFSSSIKKKIILRQLTHNLMAHEMAHAWDFEGGLNIGEKDPILGEEFRKSIGLDMKNREPQNIALKGEIKRLMVDALRVYPEHQFISELFARYFELLSMSRNVRTSGNFTTAEVMDFFANTTNFIEKKFNPKIRSKIDPKITAHTIEVVKQVKLLGEEKKFQEKVDSFHQKSQDPQNKSSSWSKNVKSNANWQKGWNKYQEIQDDKK